MSDALLTSAGEAEGLSHEVKAIAVMAAFALAAFVLAAIGIALASPEASELSSPRSRRKRILSAAAPGGCRP